MHYILYKPNRTDQSILPRKIFNTAAFIPVSMCNMDNKLDVECQTFYYFLNRTDTSKNMIITENFIALQQIIKRTEQYTPKLHA